MRTRWQNIVPTSPSQRVSADISTNPFVLHNFYRERERRCKGDEGTGEEAVMAGSSSLTLCGICTSIPVPWLIRMERSLRRWRQVTAQHSPLGPGPFPQPPTFKFHEKRSDWSVLFRAGTSIIELLAFHKWSIISVD